MEQEPVDHGKIPNSQMYQCENGHPPAQSSQYQDQGPVTEGYIEWPKGSPLGFEAHLEQEPVDHNQVPDSQVYQCETGQPPAPLQWCQGAAHRVNNKRPRVSCVPGTGAR